MDSHGLKCPLSPGLAPGGPTHATQATQGYSRSRFLFFLILAGAEINGNLFCFLLEGPEGQRISAARFQIPDSLGGSAEVPGSDPPTNTKAKHTQALHFLGFATSFFLAVVS